MRHPLKSRYRNQTYSAEDYDLDKRTSVSKSCNLFAAGGVGAANSWLSQYLLPTHLGNVTGSFHARVLLWGLCLRLELWHAQFCAHLFTVESNTIQQYSVSRYWRNSRHDDCIIGFLLLNSKTPSTVTFATRHYAPDAKCSRCWKMPVGTSWYFIQ